MCIYFVDAPITGWHEVSKEKFENYRNHLVDGANAISEHDREKSILVDAGFFVSVPAFLTLYKADPLRMYVKLEQIGAGKYEEPCKWIRDYLLY